MAVYRFRVAFEDYDDVVRDIEIKSTQTFEDLHNAIQQHVGFDGSKPSSFYMSDDNWKKGQEITNRTLADSEKEKAKEMGKARLLDYIADPHQKIYYVFDLPLHWTFHVELVKIQVNVGDGTEYPRCVRSLGEAPKQYGNIATGPLPQPDDFDGTEVLDEEEPEADEIFSAETDTVEADEVPLGVESASDESTGFEEEEGGVIDEDEPKGEDF